MNDLGVLAAMLYVELTGVSPGGLVVPAYFALYFHAPERLVITVLTALVCMAVVRFLSRYMILYGRRRYFVFLAAGMALKLGLNLSGFGLGSVIGYLVPGMLGRDMEKQGIPLTLASLAIATVLTALGGLLLGVWR